MSRLIGLVRHGAHDDLGRVLSGRTSDIGLNATGHAEATELAGRLGSAGPDRRAVALQSSPQRRTVETAAVIGEVLELGVTIVPAFDEIDFGGWSGRAFADLEPDADWQHWNAARDRAPTPGGETMAEAVTRAVRHLDTLAREGGGPVLIVSHSDMIRGVIAHLLGLSLQNILRFDIDPASVSWVAADGQGGGRVLTVNGRE